MATKLTNKIQAAVLSFALMLPAGSALAATTHHHHRRHVTSYTTYTTVRHRHHYSRTRGTVVGAVAGALIDHRHPLTGAVIGGAVGNAVQAARDHH